MNSVLTLFADLKDSKKLMAFIIFCGALSSAFKALTISLTKVIGDMIFEDKPTFPDEVVGQSSFLDLDNVYSFFEITTIDPLYFAVSALSVLFILASAMRYIFTYNIRKLAETKSVLTREKLMLHYLNLDAKFKNEISEGSGSLISRILNDVLIYQQGISKLSDLIKEPFLTVFAAGWLFYLNWKIALFLFIGLPPVLIIIRRLSKSLRKHSERSQKTMESVTMTLKEGLDGARVIHSFNLEDKIHKKFKEHTNKYLATVKKIISREELSGPLTESVSSIVFSFSFLLIAYMVKNEGLTFGDFFAILAAVGFLTDSIRKTQAAFIRIQQASTARKRIGSIIDVKVEQVKVGNKKFPQDLTKIEFKNLTVKIKEKTILDSINFKINAGQNIALVGPSGSGKTTLLNCLDLYLKPSSGEVLFNGIPSLDISNESLRRNISLVSQDPFLFNETVLENFKLIKPDITEKEAEEALILANAQFVLKREEGVHALAGERGVNFSGGERQRISIARALIKNSPILLLDEATSALDVQSEKEVQKGLDSLKKGRTCFVVAHRLSTIKDADLILVFKSGRIIESGDHDTLISMSGTYSELYKTFSGI